MINMPYSYFISSNNSLLVYLELGCYVLLLFLFIPFKIDQNYDDSTHQFQQYLIKFNKSYPNETIYKLRLQAFKNSLKAIKLLNDNKTNASANYGLTKFSDLMPEEFFDIQLQKHHIQLKHERTSLGTIGIKSLSKRDVYAVLPKKVDWRSKNVITKVRNQNNCGACWAFSAIETLESMYAIKTGKLEEFSIQQMIDCSNYNYGCEGGDICLLLRWMKMQKVKVVRETEYPLLYKSNHCKNVTNSKTEVFLRDYTCDNLANSENRIVALLAQHGPLAVAINARTWQHYIGGVIQYHCDPDELNLNHAVQIVGYDLTAHIPYYVVRNSWGSDFGDNGYLYIAIGRNVCGLAFEVSSLTLS